MCIGKRIKGERAVYVRQVMSGNPVVIDPEANLEEARKLILNSGTHILVVAENGDVRGVVSHLDLLRDIDGRTHVSDVMDRDFLRVHEEFDVREASNIMVERAKPAIVVLSHDDKLAGIVTPRDIMRALMADEVPMQLSVESAAIYLSMTRSREYEQYWLDKVEGYGYRAAATQVGAGPDKLALRLRESMIAAAVARGVIGESSREKIAISNAVRDAYAQLAMINPGLGGGFKLAVVRGDGRVSVSIFGRFGHALADGPEQLAVGYSII
ncbi:MAG TPA: CBS domain-containing protein [Firmicutes bacterium]|nr:CBS domain-containing protein [Bacillota bacterium]